MPSIILVINVLERWKAAPLTPYLESFINATSNLCDLANSSEDSVTKLPWLKKLAIPHILFAIAAVSVPAVTTRPHLINLSVTLQPLTHTPTISTADNQDLVTTAAVLPALTTPLILFKT